MKCFEMSGKSSVRGQAVECAYLYDLADEKWRVVPRVHEERPGNDLTVVERLRAQASFSQAARINELEHLIADEENSALPQWENKQSL